MSAIKTTLKATKAALDAHQYEEAIKQAKSVISTDSTNYNAHVFLGLAYDKLDHNDASEAAYKVAIKSREKEPLAWQGLLSLYEKQGGEKLDIYHDVAVSLAEAYMEKDDRNRCQTALDKYTNDARKYGSQSQYRHSLEVYLPHGLLYEYLEGRIPHPASTYVRIADIVEAEEKEKINTEIGQRRSRLGAKFDQVTRDVKREVLEGSQLEDLYAAVVDWTLDDEVRRKYEEKLLKRVYEHLAALPLPRKAAKREQVLKLAEGLVILKHPFLLAWNVKLEWSDVSEFQDLDISLLQEYTSLFPDEGLSKVIKGFFKSDMISSAKTTEGAIHEYEEDDSGPLSEENRLLLMSEGLEESSTSILANSIMGQYYLHLEEHESAATSARRGRDRIRVESTMSGLSLGKTLDAMNMILATALVRYKAPRHHPEATELFEGILERRPTETAALLGIGLILEEQEDYAGAVEFLGRALERSTDPKIRAEAAWCKALNGDDEASLQELEACLPEVESSDPRTRSLRSQILYRIGMCIWNRDQSSSARKSRDGAYSRFIKALQLDLDNAPAYTSLGIYYADYAKDRKRARKCFQKAFELSSSEVEAAQRLAQSFAATREWDLVEVVASRVIESGRVKQAPGSKKKAVSWPFAALGVVQLNNQEYHKSAVSYQSALRIAPIDYHCWIGLGESYHNCGRYIAATKAFEQAQKLEATTEDEGVKDNWFSKYMLANVRRELGEYEHAIAGYQAVLQTRPAEFGVSIALLQSLVESAWHSIELGFFGRAVETAKDALNVAQDIAKTNSAAFNLWKTVGDACSIFTFVHAYAIKFPTKQLKSLLETNTSLELFDTFADIDGIGQDALKSLDSDNLEAEGVLLSIRAAILAHKRAIHTCTSNVHARSVAWYNLGWMEHRAHLYKGEHNKSSSQSTRKVSKHLKAAAQSFKRAIELEAGNAEFWNSLGIVTSQLSPMVSQHSFVRSLHINDKNARVWTNLGTFYLIQDDYQLANEAFTRAQSSDPDYAQAWVGQGLLATRLADKKEARTLFTHAFEISDSASTMIKRQFVISTFDHLLSSPTSTQTSDVLQPLFALHQLRVQVPADLAFRHLSSLFAERLGDYADAASTLESIAGELEKSYETSESPTILTQFAQTKADLARVQLADRNFEAAVNNAESAINLSGTDEQGIKEFQKVRLSAHMTAGLAYYYQGSMDQAIDMFRNALEETQGDPDIICLLARMLWAKGGDEEKSVAREQLFDCIEKHPGHFDAIVLLGAVAVLDNDQDTVEAVTADLQNLRTRDDLDVPQQSKINHLLATIASLFSKDDDKHMAELTEARTATMLAPSKPHGWSQLAGLAEDIYPAEVAVLTATRNVPPAGRLDAGDLSKAYAGTGLKKDAQRAIMLAPWMSSAWEALAR